MELNQFRDVDLVVDKANDNFIQRQFVSQGDYRGRTMTVQVTDNGLIGKVIGLTLNLRWQNQASGLADLSAFECIDAENSIFRIEYPEHMMTPGKVIANIQVIQDGHVTHLKQFELTVQKLAGEMTGIVEQAEYGALVAILADANKFRTDIDTLETKKADKTSLAKTDAEVAVARGVFNTLDERLTTKEQEVKAQLAQTVEEVNRAASELTMDSEVILARGGETSLAKRLAHFDENSNMVSENLDKLIATSYPFYSGEITETTLMTDRSLLKIKKYMNNNVKTFKQAFVNGTPLKVLKPEEYVEGVNFHRLYNAVRFKDLSVNHIYINEFSARISFTVSDTSDLLTGQYSDMYKAFSSNSKFEPEVQLNFNANTMNYVGFHTDGNVNINFTKEEVVNSGYEFSDHDIREYLANKVDDFKIYIRRKDYTVVPYNFYLQTESEAAITKDSDVNLTLDAYTTIKKLEGLSFKKYTATVKNRLKSTDKKRPVKLYSSFDYGICSDETHIVVSDNEGRIIPHQWEDDYHVNYKIGDNFGRYSDGSLKDGYIYLLDSFNGGEEKTYSIYVYQNSVSKFESMVSETKNNKDVKVTAGDLSIDFLESKKYLVSGIKKNLTTSFFEQDPAYKTSLTDTVSVRRDAGTNVKSFEIIGSGAVFKKAKLVLTNSLFDITVITKIFYNQEVEMSTTFKAIRNIGPTQCYGTMGRINFSIGNATPVINEKLISFGWADETDSLNKSARILYAHGDWPRDASNPPRPRYREFAVMVHSYNSDLTIKRIIGGWQYDGNDTLFDIPVGEVFTSGFLVNLGGYTDSHEDEDDRSYNKLVGRLTNQTKLNMKSSILSKASENIRNIQLDPDGDYESAYLAYAGKIADWKMFGIGDIDSIFNDFKNHIQSSYGGNDVDSIYTAYTGGRLGLNVTCRTLLPPSVYFIKEYTLLGNLEKVEFCETLLKSYAETLCRAYEEFGFVPMRYSSSATGSPSNATASALRGLATGIYLDETNERWDSAYTGLETYFAKFLPVKNVICDSDTATFPSYQYLHYSTFAAFEYLKATEFINKVPIVNMTQYSFNATSAYGAAREQEYCISSSRRGLGHTNAYLIYMLLKEDTVSSVAQAEKIISRLLEQNRSEGGHDFPLEQWRYEPAQPYSASAPFETQILTEAIYLLLDQHVKSLY